MLVDGAGAGVVGGERKLLVVVVPIEQLAQIGDAGADVLFGVERISDAELAAPSPASAASAPSRPSANGRGD